ncbi:hypothetical protein LWI29_036279 [Acer saccharum]|uniref:Uncharacterized protein n=1 Tax=Acer saccharum TaxID=4024 RepID=A0AA39SXW7_ACESA|nr:hypothetical protein LWI29_036279 [Acer saccharum]
MKFMKPFTLFKELQKMKPLNRGHFLGLRIIDNKHVDLAMSDPSNKNAVPLSAINMEECNMDLMAEKFQTLNSKHNFTGFVVGFPYLKCYHVNQSSETTVMQQYLRQYAVTVMNFIDDLSKTGKLQGLKYTYWDEIFALEMRYMKPMNLFKEWIRNPLDGGCLLGLCIHDKAVHLAVSGPDNVNAVPISASQHCSAIPIPREEYYKDLMVDKFQTLISEYNLIGFVVEYPYKGSDLCRVEEIKKIINDLSKIRNFQSLKYTYWEESIATEVMDFVVDHHVEFVLENLKPDLESKSKQIIKDFVVKKFVAARLLQGYLDCGNTTVAIENYKVRK